MCLGAGSFPGHFHNVFRIRYRQHPGKGKEIVFDTSSHRRRQGVTHLFQDAVSAVARFLEELLRIVK
jgi:hypothetical protein